ncbi:hypothetical protein V6Z11_A06G021200 [Gossypium hirsutum]
MEGLINLDRGFIVEMCVGPYLKIHLVEQQIIEDLIELEQTIKSFEI